jgi:hypothetical protein
MTATPSARFYFYFFKHLPFTYFHARAFLSLVFWLPFSAVYWLCVGLGGGWIVPMDALRTRRSCRGQK